MIKNDDLRHIIRFALPVTLENMLTMIIGLIVPALVGGISGSALAAVGMGNQVVVMYNSLLALASTGGAILLARSIGSGDYAESSRIAEQNILLTLLFGLVLAAGSYAAASPIMRLLMSTAEEGMFSEAVDYFRYMMISFPPYILYVVSSAMLRAAGESRGPMLATGVLNVVHVAASWVLIRGMGLGIAGAGAAYVVARCACCAVSMIMLFRYHTSFCMRLKHLFHLHFPTWKRIMRIGVPTSMETAWVQAGYLIANSMIIGLGAHQATVYQVTNTLYTFAAFPQNIFAPILVSFVGQQLGAGNVPKAKKILWGIYLTGMTASLVMSLGVTLSVGPLSRFYTADPQVLAECRVTVWHMFIMCIPAMSINAMDPGLRTGGDGKWIMAYTVFGVWAVRIPLTYLFCYTMNLGVPGLFIANTISLTFRSLCSHYRFHTGKWLHKSV